MLRVLIALGTGLLLAGCWVSDRNLFGTEDLARLDLPRDYTVINAQVGSAPATVTVRADRLVAVETRLPINAEIAPPPGEAAAEPATTVWGFVPVPGAESYYLVFLVDDEKDAEVDYYLARGYEGAFEFYVPSCKGTVASTEGMELGSASCRFTTREAIFAAARRAIEFLEADHILAITPAFGMAPVREPEQPSPGEENESAE